MIKMRDRVYIFVCVFTPPFFFFRTVATPLASLLGVKDKQRVLALPNPILESHFCSTSKHPTQVITPHNLNLIVHTVLPGHI